MELVRSGWRSSGTNSAVARAWSAPNRDDSRVALAWSGPGLGQVARRSGVGARRSEQLANRSRVVGPRLGATRGSLGHGRASSWAKSRGGRSRLPSEIDESRVGREWSARRSGRVASQSGVVGAQIQASRESVRPRRRPSAMRSHSTPASARPLRPNPRVCTWRGPAAGAELTVARQRGALSPRGAPVPPALASGPFRATSHSITPANSSSSIIQGRPQCMHVCRAGIA